MPAPDYASLYDFESQIEDLFVTILKTYAIPGIYPSRDANKIQTPSVVLRFVTGSPGTQRTTKGTPPRLVPVGYEGTMFAEVITGRRNTDAPDHGAIRGQVRYLLSAGANLVNTTNSPWLQILEILPSGGTPQTTDDKDLDRSVLQFAFKFAIRDDAWPA
jgi:hypothetical protein